MHDSALNVRDSTKQTTGGIWPLDQFAYPQPKLKPRCSKYGPWTCNVGIPLQRLRHRFRPTVEGGIYLFIYLFICFLGLLPPHMEVPRLGVELELQLPAYAIATAAWGPSYLCDLYHSSWQRQIFNPLSEARDLTRVLMHASRVC